MVLLLNDTATTHTYTLSLHDALPISSTARCSPKRQPLPSLMDRLRSVARSDRNSRFRSRSEEHTSELQSQSNLVCRLLLEKKNQPEQPTQHTSKRPTEFGDLGRICCR